MTVSMTQTTNSLGTMDYLYDRNDDFRGTNDQSYGASHGGCMTWSRDTVHSEDEFSGGGELILLRHIVYCYVLVRLLEQHADPL
ncbi:unnamed protein product [Rotaria socialis]